MQLTTEDLKKVFVGSGFVAEKDFNETVESAAYVGSKVEDVLVFRGLLKEEAVAKLVAEYIGVPYVDISKTQITAEVLALVPERLARQYRMIPFAKEGSQLKMAMENPKDFEALEFARRKTRLQVIPYYAGGESIRRALGQYKSNIRADYDKVIAENVKKTSPQDDPQKAAEGLPIIKVLDTIVEYAVAERASDIHIETMADEVVVRFRIDGKLRDIIKLPRGIEIALVARIKILSNLKIDEHRIPQDGRYKFKVDDDVIALRVSVMPGFYAENVVMRLLPESTRPLSLGELGISGHNLKVMTNAIHKPYGMVLVSGPTGSGKTTTLYSILNILNTPKVKIATIEDPIEYGIRRITQIQLNVKAGLDFAAGLRSLLRHDPDIIMVGEVRDNETAEIAVHSAMTGHLMLSTLHTNSAAGAIPRFMDMGVEGYLLSSTVNVVLAQRLVRKICSACLAEYKPDEEILTRLKNEVGSIPKNQKYYKGQGCKECHGNGFIGRIGVYEALEVTDSIRELIIKKAGSDKIQEKAVEEGMITMLQDGLDKVASGLTTIDEVLNAVRES